MKRNLRHGEKYLTVVRPAMFSDNPHEVWETEADLGKGHMHPLVSKMFSGTAQECREFAGKTGEMFWDESYPNHGKWII